MTGVKLALARSIVRMRQVEQRSVQQLALEKRYVRKDGTASWLAVSASGVFDDNGKFLYSFGSCKTSINGSIPP
jgi:hypothetical protein